MTLSCLIKFSKSLPRCPQASLSHLMNFIFPDSVLHVALLLGLTPMRVKLVDLAGDESQLDQVICL